MYIINEYCCCCSIALSNGLWDICLETKPCPGLLGVAHRTSPRASRARREESESSEHRKNIGKSWENMGMSRKMMRNHGFPWISYCDDYLRIGLWMSMGKSWNILRQVDRKIRREIHRCFELCFDGKNHRCLTLFP